MAFKLLSLLGKNSDYTAEYKRFKNALDRNPRDSGLKTQFIKFCLLNRFTKQEVTESHIMEALKLFETVQSEEIFDLQCYYLVGKYYQENQNYKTAYQIYLDAIRRFNKAVVQKPALKSEYAELVYSVALNLMSLQPNPVAWEVEQCFKFLRKSFPLHLKRIEFENEMAKPVPDQVRIKQLTEEIRKLKEEEEKAASVPEEAQAAPTPEPVKETSPAPEEKKTPEPPLEQIPGPSEPKRIEVVPTLNPVSSKGVFSKLFRDLSPVSIGFSKIMEKDARMDRIHQEENEDSLKLALPDSAFPDAIFMAYHNDRWEGPFTRAQLKEQGFLEPGTWVCRIGSEQVIQAYEVPDLHTLLKL